MTFTPTTIYGSYVVDLDPRYDNRGFFARTFCSKTFAEQGLNLQVTQCNLTFNKRRGTLRGLHFQLPPMTEAKLLRCTRGAIYEVIVDLRPHSPTFLSHAAVELTADNRRAFYIPEMCAAGYQALTDETEATYHVSEVYAPELERGVRYDDPLFQIEWPLPITELSEKDRSWAPFDLARHKEEIYDSCR